LSIASKRPGAKKLAWVFTSTCTKAKPLF
jgi:hypothetical protein